MKKEKMVKTGQMQQKQLREMKRQKLKQSQQNKLEGLRIRQQAIQDIEQEKETEMSNKLKNIKLAGEVMNSNLASKALKEKLKNQALEEDLQILAYQKNKDEMQEFRKQKELERFKEKQETRNKLIKRQEEYLINCKKTENERTENRLEEAEKRAIKEFQEKQERKKLLQEQINLSRQQQILRKKTEADEIKYEDKEFKEFWDERNKELLEMESNEINEDITRNKQLQSYLKKQIDQKTRKKQEAIEKQKFNDQMAKEMLETEDIKFASYAEKCMKEWSDTGKNVKPLILELKN